MVWYRCFAEGKTRRKREFLFIRNQAKTCKVFAYILIDRKVDLRARERFCLKSHVCEVIWVECLCVGVSGSDLTSIAGTRKAPTHYLPILIIICMLRQMKAEFYTIYNILST